ncbi:hypothetical protein ACFL0S_01670 [Thermodesulfobacteriota bacterium]
MKLKTGNLSTPLIIFVVKVAKPNLLNCDDMYLRRLSGTRSKHLLFSFLYIAREYLSNPGTLFFAQVNDKVGCADKL